MNPLKHVSAAPDDRAAREDLLRRYDSARARRQPWESLWQDCYDFALSAQGAGFTGTSLSIRRGDRVYDATAMDAVDQLAASLLGSLTPPWTQWFGFRPGPDLSPAQAAAIAPALENAGRTLRHHFDRSNFSVEMHQCFLDLVVGGTACLAFEEAAPGEFTAFRFTAIPLAQIALEEGPTGALDGTYRMLSLTLGQIQARYPEADVPSDIARTGTRDPQQKFSVMESLLPEAMGYRQCALLMEASGGPAMLRDAMRESSPILNFRWMKSPGDIYGRSPVMKALPDIRTANKVVELILKNASIAVTGIWQADDDGVLNPANIELVPGAIIPKAVGSQGLKALEMPARFDVSQLVLDDLRARIRHALLTDRLGQVSGPRMSATEILERAAESALLLGATYGRLQSELLTPLIVRAHAILRRRGEIPDIALDGRLVAIDYRSPLARAQGQRNVQNTLGWLSSVAAMGAQGLAVVDLPAAARALGEALGVSPDLMRAQEEKSEAE